MFILNQCKRAKELFCKHCAYSLNKEIVMLYCVAHDNMTGHFWPYILCSYAVQGHSSDSTVCLNGTTALKREGVTMVISNVTVIMSTGQQYLNQSGQS